LEGEISWEAHVVHAANIHDTKPGINPARQACEKYASIKEYCGDQGYRKSFEDDVLKQLGLGVDIVERISHQFLVQPKRWLVECTFVWIGHSRCLSNDYEIRTDSAETMVKISHIHTLLPTLASSRYGFLQTRTSYLFATDA